MPTSAALRAAKADEERLAAQDATSKRKRGRPKKEVPDTAELDTETFPCDAIIAAAINQEHRFSRVLAVGMRDRKVVILEHMKTDYNQCDMEDTQLPKYRAKVVVYTYYRTRAEAMKFCQKQGVSIKEYCE